MRREAALLWHEARLMFSWAFPAALLVAIAALVLVLRDRRDSLLALAAVDPGLARDAAGAWAARVTEIVLPLAAVTATGHATVLDREAGTAELVRSLSPWRPAVPLRRLAAGWGSFLLALPLVAAVSRLAGVDYDLARAAAAPLAPAAFLTGLALAGSTLLRSSAGGVAAAMVVWVSDFLRPGVLTGRLYLFAIGSSCCVVGRELLVNRLGLAAAGAGLAALALWLDGQGGGWTWRS